MLTMRVVMMRGEVDMLCVCAMVVGRKAQEENSWKLPRQYAVLNHVLDGVKVVGDGLVQVL